MACITISVSTRCDRVDCYYSYRSSTLDGMYSEGSFDYSHRGVPSKTMDECYEIAVQNTVKYLGGTFKRVYGREMTRYDICGQGEDPATAARDLAAKALFDFQEAERKLLADKQQIELKTQMLESGTTVWASEEAYTNSIDIVNANIDAFNPQIQVVEQLRETAIVAGEKVRPQPLGTLTKIQPDKITSPSASIAGFGISVLLIPIVIIMTIIVLVRRK